LVLKEVKGNILLIVFFRWKQVCRPILFFMRIIHLSVKVSLHNTYLFHEDMKLGTHIERQEAQGFLGSPSSHL
jgi:hypothetical protein